VSTTMDLRPAEAKFEPLPTLQPPPEAAEAWTEAPPIVAPLRAATRSRKRRFRLSRRARLARTVLVLLMLEVTLSSFGALPGNGWPLSLFAGHKADASFRSVEAIVPAAAPASHRLSPVAPDPVRPTLLAFAAYKGLTLYVPTDHLLGIGYHEASWPDALPLTPLGRCVSNDNKTRIRSPRANYGPDYVIMPTRYRAQGPTTAADVAMPKGSTVVAPISGRVVKIMLYRLYKYWLDYRLVIRPGRGIRLQVVIIHLTDLMIHRGQLVEAGVTPLGHPRLFPFQSDINDYVGAGVPHVHLEVKEIGPSGRKA
jgi:hypothetical protein